MLPKRLLSRFISVRPSYRFVLVLGLTLGLASGLASTPGPAVRTASAAGLPGLLETTGRIEVDAMKYPWSAIGRVNAAGRGHCTGFLIGERHALTAAHCLYDRIEGRWFGANEIHFVAGYQRDRFLVSAGVESYEASDRFQATVGPSTANAIADWAVLTLDSPVGREAGWLGLQQLDSALRARLRRGKARLVQAGYRRGWKHIMSASFDCRIAGWFLNDMGLVHSCDVAQGDSGSPLLVLSRGEARVAGLHVLNTRTDDGALAGVLSVARFAAGAGDPQAVRALARVGGVWSPGHTPTADPARRPSRHGDPMDRPANRFAQSAAAPR